LLLPRAPKGSPFREITELPFGRQMREALVMTDAVSLDKLCPKDAPFEVEEHFASARAFFRPRFDAQAKRVAAHPTPFLLMSQELPRFLDREHVCFSAPALEAVHSSPQPSGPRLYDFPTAWPYAFALVESGLMSVRPARAMLVSLLEMLRTRDLRTYFSAFMKEVDPARRGRARSPLLTADDRTHVASLPFEASVAVLLRLTNGDTQQRLRALGSFDILVASRKDLRPRARRLRAIVHLQQWALGTGGLGKRLRERIDRQAKPLMARSSG
jgi:hypothetical protein